tara:strand:- start:203 stop:433 length:231 start_codon:yes stop_codon:yes gene_type:complete
MEESGTPRTVTMTCMTTKKKFDVVQPEVTVLKNGRYAFRVPCPWDGKNGKKLFAFKFCSSKDYQEQCERRAANESK